MNRKIAALQNSIEHWRRIRDCVPGEKPNGEQCACCQIAEPNCIDCPVFEYTQTTYCHITPYKKAYAAYINYHRIIEHPVTKKQFQTACQREINFLKLVLKKAKEEEKEKGKKKKKAFSSKAGEPIL